jgi:hypothetical protein
VGKGKGAERLERGAKFLGLEVCQEPGHIFPGQGKYACDILRRFQMEDCRPMTTPMITNCKKLHAYESQLVDSKYPCNDISSHDTQF